MQHRHRPVQPLGVVVDVVLFPVDTADAAQPPVIRRARAKLLAVVSVFLGLLPYGARRVAGGIRITGPDWVSVLVRGRRPGIGETGALIIVAVDAARVVGVVLLLRRYCAPGSCAAYTSLIVADLAVDGQRGVLELVLVVGGVVQGDRQRWQRHAALRLADGVEGYSLGAVRHLVKDALRVHVLIALREQRIPVLVHFPQHRRPDSLVGDRIDGVARPRCCC